MVGGLGGIWGQRWANWRVKVTMEALGALQRKENLENCYEGNMGVVIMILQSGVVVVGASHHEAEEQTVQTVQTEQIVQTLETNLGMC